MLRRKKQRVQVHHFISTELLSTTTRVRFIFVLQLPRGIILKILPHHSYNMQKPLTTFPLCLFNNCMLKLCLAIIRFTVTKALKIMIYEIHLHDNRRNPNMSLLYAAVTVGVGITLFICLHNERETYGCKRVF